ncbi:MAG: DEAD/DEAH box helicase [Chloroflexi bacterium]|nr:MAG: DEAD/DEAH box helicase [Chloroflexota bacterium]
MTTLFPVQQTAYDRAKGKRRYGYFLEMGLGKTLLALHEFEGLLNDGDVDIMMIFCPNSLISTWKSEIEKHGYKFNILTKPDSHRQVERGSVILYNYESIIASPGKQIANILTIHRAYAVFDESVQIKNHKAARWKLIEKWQHMLTYARLLSGRPTVQSPMDLWTQLTMLRGAVSKSPYAFRNTYCRMGGWMNKQVIGTMNPDQLTKIVNEVAFVATKKQWTDLPEKLYTDRTYEMTMLQKHAYDKMFRDMIVEIQSRPISVQQAVHKYSKLQQVGSGFMFDETGEAVPIMNFDGVPKLKVLEEILEETDGKVIVFAHYRPSVEALSKHFKCPTIRGGMKEEEIKNVIEEFNNGDHQVFVGQLAAAKYGLTLLGHPGMPCHTTVYFENSYSLDARIQSEDRNHRHGQKNSVLYIDLMGTAVERKIVRALQHKDDISRLVMGMNEEVQHAA